jgi:MFS family permease
LASAIATMNGVCGMENWRWIFVLEGVGIIVVGVVAFILISEFPDQAQWLTPEEREFIIHRGGHNETQNRSLTLKDILSFFMDPKLVLGAFMYWGEHIPLSIFLKTLLILSIMSKIILREGGDRRLEVGEDDSSSKEVVEGI